MKKNVKNIVFVLWFLFATLLFNPSSAQAVSESCRAAGITLISTNFPSGSIVSGASYDNVSFQISGVNPSSTYYLRTRRAKEIWYTDDVTVGQSNSTTPNSAGVVTLNYSSLLSSTTSSITTEGWIDLMRSDGSAVCVLKTFTFNNGGIGCGTITITQAENPAGCYTGGAATWSATGFTDTATGDGYSDRAFIRKSSDSIGASYSPQEISFSGGSATGEVTLPTSSGSTFIMTIWQTRTTTGTSCPTSVNIRESCIGVEPGEDPTALTAYKICNQLSDEDGSLTKCDTCYKKEGIWTAVGCISTDGTSMVTQILQIAMGIAGGIALIMILAAGFMLSVSQGDPKRVTEAREMITSAIIGLIFIVFSVTILQFIGVHIFQIPGLGG